MLNKFKAEVSSSTRSIQVYVDKLKVEIAQNIAEMKMELFKNTLQAVPVKADPMEVVPVKAGSLQLMSGMAGPLQVVSAKAGPVEAGR